MVRLGSQPLMCIVLFSLFLICFIKGFSIRLEIVSTPVGTNLFDLSATLIFCTVSAQGLFEGAPGGESLL